MQDSSDRTSLKERKNQANEKLQKQQELRRQCIEILVKTKEGRMFLQYLYKVSGFGMSPTVQDINGKVDVERTFTMIGRADVYKEIRQNMSGKIIELIEGNE